MSPRPTDPRLTVFFRFSSSSQGVLTENRMRWGPRRKGEERTRGSKGEEKEKEDEEEDRSRGGRTTVRKKYGEEGVGRCLHC